MNTFIKSSYEICLFAMLLINIRYSNIAAGANDPNGVQIAIQQAMEDVRINHISIPKEILDKYGPEVIPTAEGYLQDQNRQVRFEAYELIGSASTQIKDNLVRQRIVEKLLGNCLEDADLKYTIFKAFLSIFKAEDYSETSKQLLHTELTMSPEYVTILLVGVANMSSEQPLLKKIIDEIKEPLQPFNVDKKKTHKPAFAALMAMARMNVKEDIQRCIDFVESYPDEGFRVVVLLNEISYVRQPEVVEYLKQYLYMDKIEPGPETQAGPEIQIKLTYADRAIMALSKMLINFPKRKPGEFESEKYTELIRKWMSEQTSWQIIR